MNYFRQKLIQTYQFYNNWHQTQHHNKIHWGMFLIFLFISLSLLMNPPGLTFKNSSIIPQLNIQKANAGTTLEDLAASMQPGEWAVLETIGFDNGQFFSPIEFGCNSGDSINQYADSATWDPVQKRFMFIGTTHGNCYASKFAIYQDNNNSWSTGPWIPNACQWGTSDNPCWFGVHAFDHNTVDPATGDFYYRSFGSIKIYKYGTLNDAWSELPPIPMSSSQVAGALEYFPEMDGLVFVDGDWGVWIYRFSANQWTHLANTSTANDFPGQPNLPMGSNRNFIEYNPIHKVLLFGGGGTTDLYKMDASGVITKMNNAPIALGIPGDNTGTVTTVDPISGKYLILGYNKSFYEYDVTTDTWTSLPTDSIPVFIGEPVFDLIETPVSTYGVIMFVKYYSDQSKIYLYKHSPGTGTPLPTDTEAPSIPANLAGVAVSSSQINLSWTASTDNIGVTGYQVYQDGTQIAASNTTSYSATGLSPATTYAFAVSAKDAAANQSAKSASVTATTKESSSTGSDFTSRCSASGVVRCVGFDSSSDLGGDWGDNSGTLPGDPKYPPSIDTSVRSSGDGSLKFTIPSQSGAGAAGSYFTNFSTDLSTLFGENSEFYIQWRQRFSPELINTRYNNSGGFKHVIIGTGDTSICNPAAPSSNTCPTSCTPLEVVVQNSGQKGFAQMYNSCTGSASHGPYDPFLQNFHSVYGSYDYKLQNARPDPYCLYLQYQTSYFPPTGNCFGYFPDEWMTFQVHIKTGPRIGDEFSNSHVDLWIAREGRPSEQALNWGPYNLTAGDPTQNYEFGKLWLTPYQTGKDATQVHPTAYTWYDDLIVSRTKIADPNGTPPPTDTTPPSVPTNLTATAVSSSQINLSWIASTDNTEVTGYKIYRDGNQIATSNTTSYSDTNLSPSTAYAYTISAYDAGGNNSAQSSSAQATTKAESSNQNITIGETNILSIDDSNNANLLIAQSATLSQPATIQSLSFYVKTASGKLRLGIYDATGLEGGPGNKKAETNEITPITGWNTVNVITPTPLPAGTYWLAYLPNDNNLHFVRNGTGSAKYYSYPYAAMPKNFGTSLTSITDHWSFYATLIAIKPSDLNQDGKVDSTDFNTLKLDWNKTTKPKSDINQDGIVDSRDLGIMMGEWG